MKEAKVSQDMDIFVVDRKKEESMVEARMIGLNLNTAGNIGINKSGCINKRRKKNKEYIVPYKQTIAEKKALASLVKMSNQHVRIRILPTLRNRMDGIVEAKNGSIWEGTVTIPKDVRVDELKAMLGNVIFPKQDTAASDPPACKLECNGMEAQDFQLVIDIVNDAKNTQPPNPSCPDVIFLYEYYVAS
eukprot:TRINITY_DN5966_c0_g1_i1.p1 TRINITY_DN5966_c0_g1~~TRINITY_DN5966_c0_g1_i1.p1  ORF type:complete len:189 (+),score=33.78 TRINITY_DN5966_c0_g1_i1:75-641(+)